MHSCHPSLYFVLATHLLKNWIMYPEASRGLDLPVAYLQCVAYYVFLSSMFSLNWEVHLEN